MLQLGDALVSEGKVSSQQLLDALAQQAETGQRLGTILVENGWVEIEDVLAAVVAIDRTRTKRDRLGDMLVEKGYATRLDIGRAIAIQSRDSRDDRRLLGRVLLDECIITEDQLLDVIGQLAS